MTDIVKRLRSPEVLIVDSLLISPVAYKAADEIERLRIENKKLCKTVEFYAIQSNWDYWIKNQMNANTRAWQTLEELK